MKLTPEVDPALLEEIIAEEEIATQRSATRLEWVQHVLGHYWNELLERLAGASPLVAQLAEALLWAVVVGVPLLVLYLLWKRMRGLRDTRQEARAPVQVEELEQLPEERDLRRTLDEELARGRPREALRWAWIWLARRLAEKGVGRFDIDVTNREFADSVRRLNPEWPGHASLHALARRSDRLLYGDAGCEEDDVRGFLREAEELSA